LGLFRFLTNNTALRALAICARYKSRWLLELFFKWLEQHLRSKHFLGRMRRRADRAA
jgi:IS4 transposase